MDFLIIGAIAFIGIVVLAYVFDYSRKELKHIGKNEELDALAKIYPSNQEMCQEFLKKLENEGVQI